MSGPFAGVDGIASSDHICSRGEVHQPEGWFGSSAMLAFAETWREV
jgi:hypothetical protein